MRTAIILLALAAPAMACEPETKTPEPVQEQQASKPAPVTFIADPFGVLLPCTATGPTEGLPWLCTVPQPDNSTVVLECNADLTLCYGWTEPGPTMEELLRGAQ